MNFEQTENGATSLHRIDLFLCVM